MSDFSAILRDLLKLQENYFNVKVAPVSRFDICRYGHNTCLLDTQVAVVVAAVVVMMMGKKRAGM